MTRPGPDRPRVALFVTCMVEALRPDVGLAAADLLARYGAEVMVPDGQTCCGQPAFNAGYRGEGRRMAERFLEVFDPLVREGAIDAIVAPSGSCTAMVVHGFAVLFEEADPERRAAVARVARVTYELTEYLVDGLGAPGPGTGTAPGRVTYHPCCHLQRELGVDRQPRALLARACARAPVPLPGAEDCCGFGGLFAVKHGAISSAMGRRKLDNVAAADADTLVMNDVSCLTHLEGLRRREGRPGRLCHIAEFLRDAG